MRSGCFHSRKSFTMLQCLVAQPAVLRRMRATPKAGHYGSNGLDLDQIGRTRDFEGNTGSHDYAITHFGVSAIE